MPKIDTTHYCPICDVPVKLRLNTGCGMYASCPEGCACWIALDGHRLERAMHFSRAAAAHGFTMQEATDGVV